MKRMLFFLPIVSLFAGPINLNTGTAAWRVTQTSGTSNNGGGLDTETNAVILTGGLPFAANLPGNEQFAWASPGTAAWIGQSVTDGNFNPGPGCNSAAPTTTCGAMAGTYVFTLTITGAWGGSFTLTNFTADNRLSSLTVTQGETTLYACDQIANATPNCAASQSTTASSGLIVYAAGTNVVIRATAVNDVFGSRNPMGFMLQGSGTANEDPLPEPSTYAMFGLGAVALLLGRRAAK
jgi:PEP-CTERM motif